MRVLDLVDHGDVVQLDVEILVDTLERAADLDVVLELYRDGGVDQRLEEATSWLAACTSCVRIEASLPDHSRS